MKSLGWFCLAFAAILASDHACASGFALREQSAAAQGNAFAGATAGAEDVTYLFFNPAVLGRLENTHVAGVLSFVAPRSKFRGGSASTGAFAPALPPLPIQGSPQRGDIAQDVFVPALYGMLAVSDDVRFGLAINVPFGLEASYDRDWIGRYHAVDSKLMTLSLNPVVAIRATDWIFLGLGFQAQYADAELSNALDFGTIGTVLPVAFGGEPVPGAVPGNPDQDGFFELKGDAWGYGWNAGLLVEPVSGTRLGLAYRSKIEHTFHGEAAFQVPPPFDSAFAPTGLFRNTGATAELTTPESWSVGVFHEISPRWAIMAEISRTRWSRFDQLLIEFDNPAQPDNLTVHDWKDTWFHALGATFRPAEEWALRAGVAHDQSPIPDATRTPRIPDEDRTWLSLGVQWRAKPHLILNAAYTHIWVKASEIDLKASDPGNTFRGDLSGGYDNVIEIATLQLDWLF